MYKLFILCCIITIVTCEEISPLDIAKAILFDMDKHIIDEIERDDENNLKNNENINGDIYAINGVPYNSNFDMTTVKKVIEKIGEFMLRDEFTRNEYLIYD